MPDTQEAVRTFLFAARARLTRAQDVVLRHTRSDAVCIAIVLLLAILTRLPLLAHPDVTKFDEVIYADYASALVDGKPFFDIHPPLARIIFAETLRHAPPHETHVMPIRTTQSFGDFPYVTLRALVALFGIALPLVLYAIVRALGSSPRVALLIALFAVFDNALLVYARSILPDTIMLVFDALGLLLAILASKAKRATGTIIAILAGLAFGAALSVKWTALAMLATGALFLLARRRYARAMLAILTALLFYVLLFAGSLVHYFPQGGESYDFAEHPSGPWMTKIVYPPLHSMSDALAFLPSLHKDMLAANYDPYVLANTLPSLAPYAWPIAKNVMLFWPERFVPEESSGKEILMQGNSALWTFTCFGLLFECIFLVMNAGKRRKITLSSTELVLLAGFMMNHLPYYFIHRPMYLYHYFPSLLLLLLLLPFVTPRIVRCLALVTRDALFARVFIACAALLVFVSFTMSVRTVYGV